MNARSRILKAVLIACVLTAASPRRAYERTFEQGTQELKIYRGFDTALILRATLLDEPMRATIAEERRRLVNPSSEDHQEFLDRMQSDLGAFHDIVFSASSGLVAARNFGESDAGWVVWLEADGTREEMVSIERIRKPSALHRELYTHLNLWADLWVVRFRKTVVEPDEIVLHVGSGYGNGELRWKDLRRAP
jgi:hypothetical protein